MAELVPLGSSVLDLGAGSQTLKRYLDPSCSYQPCDLIRTTPETWLMDFNAGIYPTVPEPFDVVVISGVLEFARSPAEFLRRIRPFGRSFILSYAVSTKDIPVRKRREKGWLNHISRSDLEEKFQTLRYEFALVAT